MMRHGSNTPSLTLPLKGEGIRPCGRHNVEPSPCQGEGWEGVLVVSFDLVPSPT